MVFKGRMNYIYTEKEIYFSPQLNNNIKVESNYSSLDYLNQISMMSSEKIYSRYYLIKIK